MTDRLERRLPEVLTELSLPRMPDYVDDLLSRTQRMPQRPGWTFLERWFPVSTLTQAASPAGPRLALRPLIALALLLALVVASVAWYAGSQQNLPAPFGPARNGLVITTNEAGNVVAVDPVTDSAKTLVSGTDVCCIDVAPDGRTFAFVRTGPSWEDPGGLVLANVDGSNVRELAPELVRFLESLDWSPASDRLLIANAAGAVIVDAASGQSTALDVPFSPIRASWLGTSGDILLTRIVAQSPQNGLTLAVHRLPAGATTNPLFVTELEYAVNPPLVSPDGSKFMYFIWGPQERLHGRVHVFDLGAGTDRAITPEFVEPLAEKTHWENAVWSPDSSRIAVERYSVTDNQVAIIPADGGEPILVGPTFPTGTNGAAIRFSPDGTSLLVTYRFNNTTWLLPVAGGEGRKVPWAVTEEMDWQRLGP